MSFFKKVGSFLGKVGKGALKVVGGVAGGVIGNVLGGGSEKQEIVIKTESAPPVTPVLAQKTGFDTGRGSLENPIALEEAVVTRVTNKINEATASNNSNLYQDILQGVQTAAMLAGAINGKTTDNIAAKGNEFLNKTTDGLSVPVGISKDTKIFIAAIAGGTLLYLFTKKR
ncbi:hypothetical protein ACR79P_06490 [Sphingobacterium spiritivorum]|uniref:hypothetical protein n=1 Tax=Sphingobacterium spiritivorum TaxID=258 RepID=UPI003DA5D6DF